jgi:hypothetical protein
MKLKELVKLDDCPEWIKNEMIRVSYEDVVIGPHHQIVWNDGVWHSGVWEDGVWMNGNWENGVWEDGVWEDGLWKGGVWKNGTWKGGVWRHGVWEGGTWIDGVWKNGRWEKGIWEKGDWEHGVWKDGIWKDGYVHIGKSKWIVKYSTTNKSISIGCMNKTLSEWERFFNSDETCETERNTVQFENIRKCYLLAKLAIELN